MAVWKKYRFGDFLRRVKLPIAIQDSGNYKRVTIKTAHGGVSVRDYEVGKKIGTKKQFLLKEGLFVMSKIDARHGAFGIASHDVDGAIITGNFWAYEFDKEVISIDWLNNFTNSPVFYDICERSSSGITHRKYLDEKKFLNNEIWLPSIGEQYKILGSFKQRQDIFQSVRSELTHQKILLKKLRQQILQEAIEGKLTTDWRAQNPNVEPASELLKRIAAEKAQLIKDKKIKKQNPLPPITDEEKPFDLPQGWEWCRFQDVANICSNLVNPYDYYDLPHIAPNHIEKNTGKLLPYQSAREDEIISGKHLFFSGQILYSKVRPQLNKVAFAPCEGLCSADMYPIEAYIESSYLQKVMLSQHFLNEVNKFDNRVKMPKINQNQLDSIVIPCPSFLEQQAIARKIKNILVLCDQLETQITKDQTYAEQLMQAVLKEAFGHHTARPNQLQPSQRSVLMLNTHSS